MKISQNHSKIMFFDKSRNIHIKRTYLLEGRKNEDGYLCHSLPIQMLMLCSGDMPPSAVNLFSSIKTSIGAEYPVDSIKYLFIYTIIVDEHISKTVKLFQICMQPFDMEFFI